MSHDHDEGRALLDAARRASEPSDVDRARVRAGVASRLAAAAAAAGAASVTGAASAEATAAGGAGVGVSAGAAGVAGAAAGSMLKTLVVLAAVGAAAGGTGLAIRRWHAPAPRALASTAVVERLGETPRPALERPEPPAAAAPTVTPLVELAPPTLPAPAPAPAKPPPAKPPAAAPAASAASAPAASGSANALTAELEALTRARTALRGGDPAAALDALDEHARLSPSPALAEEAAALRVHALCAAGRSSEARTLATHFLDRWPRSPQAPGVRSACPSTTSETKEHP